MHTTAGLAFSKQLVSYNLGLAMNRYKKIINLYNPPWKQIGTEKTGQHSDFDKRPPSWTIADVINGEDVSLTAKRMQEAVAKVARLPFFFTWLDLCCNGYNYFVLWKLTSLINYPEHASSVEEGNNCYASRRSHNSVVTAKLQVLLIPYSKVV